jgi:hypothetical protein
MRRRSGRRNCAADVTVGARDGRNPCTRRVQTRSAIHLEMLESITTGAIFLREQGSDGAPMARDAEGCRGMARVAR